MALPKQYEGLEDALNVAAEIISECTGIPGTGSVAIGAIKELLGHAPIYTLKNVLNKKSAKTLNIPDDMYAFVFEQTHDILGSINSVDYNLKAFQEEIFIKNCFDPKKIGTELVKGLHINEKEESEVTKAVRFVLAVYLLHWTEEPGFPLETRQKLQHVESTLEKVDLKVETLDKKYDDHEDRIYKLEDNTAPIPVELTIIPNYISNLIGREAIIQDITAKLETNHVFCLTADGGLGKTAIAKNIINNIRNDIGNDNCKYKHVAWLTSSGNLKKDLSNIIIPNFASNGNENRYKKACRFLKTYPTFLVIDNMDEIPTPDEINTLNTIAGKSTILITSRAVIDSFPSYELRPLDRDAAVVLFYSHYFHNSIITDISHEKINEEIATGRIKDAYKIVDATGGNALIIELIAKTAHADVLRLTELWEKVSSGIFGFESKTEVQTDHSGKYPESKLSIDEQMRRLYSMLKLTDKQKEIMSFISLFPAEHDIFSDVFKWAGFFNQGANDMTYLVDRGWIIREDDYYSIHTIVRDSINMQNEKSGNGVSILNYDELIVRLSDIDNYIPRTMEFNLAQKLSFVPQTVGKLLSDVRICSAPVGMFFKNLANLYKNQGNFDEALKYNIVAREICKKTFGEENLYTISIYNDSACLLHNQGNYEEAQKYYKKALEIYENTLGHDHPFTATAYNNLAHLYQDLGDFKEALKNYKMALSINERTLGRNHQQTAITYNNIASLYSISGKKDEALNYYKMALAINERTLGQDHPDTATIHNNIAGIYKFKENYQEALKHYQIALAIEERTLGKNHPGTAATLNNLALLNQEQGNYCKAMELYDMALNTCIKTFGIYHPNTASTYNNIALFYQVQGNYAEAMRYYKLSLEICIKTLGKDHLSTAQTHFNIACLYKTQENYEEALEHYKMALDIQEKTLGKFHLDTVTTYSDIADIYKVLGNYNDAIYLYQIVLDICKKLFGKIHVCTVTTYSDIADCYKALGNYNDALNLYKIALEISEELFGKNHVSTISTYNNMANIYKALGNYNDALTLYKIIQELCESIFGKDHSNTIATYFNIAVLYNEQGNYDKAIEYYNNILDIVEKTYGIHPLTALAHQMLADVYLKTKNKTESLKHQERAEEILNKLNDE